MQPFSSFKNHQSTLPIVAAQRLTRIPVAEGSCREGRNIGHPHRLFVSTAFAHAFITILFFLVNIGLESPLPAFRGALAESAAVTADGNIYHLFNFSSASSTWLASDANHSADDDALFAEMKTFSFTIDFVPDSTTADPSTISSSNSSSSNSNETTTAPAGTTATAVPSAPAGSTIPSPNGSHLPFTMYYYGPSGMTTNSSISDLLASVTVLRRRRRRAHLTHITTALPQGDGGGLLPVVDSVAVDSSAVIVTDEGDALSEVLNLTSVGEVWAFARDQCAMRGMGLASARTREQLRALVRQVTTSGAKAAEGAAVSASSPFNSGPNAANAAPPATSVSDRQSWTLTPSADVLGSLVASLVEQVEEAYENNPAAAATIPSSLGFRSGRWAASNSSLLVSGPSPSSSSTAVGTVPTSSATNALSASGLWWIGGGSSSSPDAPSATLKWSDGRWGGSSWFSSAACADYYNYTSRVVASGAAASVSAPSSSSSSDPSSSSLPPRFPPHPSATDISDELCGGYSWAEGFPNFASSASSAPSGGTRVALSANAVVDDMILDLIGADAVLSDGFVHRALLNLGASDSIADMPWEVILTETTNVSQSSSGGGGTSSTSRTFTVSLRLMGGFICMEEQCSNTMDCNTKSSGVFNIQNTTSINTTTAAATMAPTTVSSGSTIAVDFGASSAFWPAVPFASSNYNYGEATPLLVATVSSFEEGGGGGSSSAPSSPLLPASAFGGLPSWASVYNSSSYALGTYDPFGSDARLSSGAPSLSSSLGGGLLTFDGGCSCGVCLQGWHGRGCARQITATASFSQRSTASAGKLNRTWTRSGSSTGVDGQNTLTRSGTRTPLATASMSAADSHTLSLTVSLPGTVTFGLPETASRRSTVTFTVSVSRTTAPTRSRSRIDTRSATVTYTQSLTGTVDPPHSQTHHPTRTMTPHVCSKQNLMGVLRSWPFNWYPANHPNGDVGRGIPSTYPIALWLNESAVRQGTAMNPFSENYWRRARERLWTQDDVRWSSPSSLHGFWEQLTSAPTKATMIVKGRSFENMGGAAEEEDGEHQRQPSMIRSTEIDTHASSAYVSSPPPSSSSEEREQQEQQREDQLTPREELRNYLLRGGIDLNQQQKINPFATVDDLLSHYRRLHQKSASFQQEDDAAIGSGQQGRRGFAAEADTNTTASTTTATTVTATATATTGSSSSSSTTTHPTSPPSPPFVQPFNNTLYWLPTPFPIIMDIVSPGDHIPLTGYFTPTHGSNAAQPNPYGFEKIIGGRQRVPSTREAIIQGGGAADGGNDNGYTNHRGAGFNGFPMMGIAINWTHMAIVLETIPDYAIGIDEIVEIHLDLRYLGYCGSGQPAFTAADGGGTTPFDGVNMRGENMYHLATLRIVTDVSPQVEPAKGLVFMNAILTALAAPEAQSIAVISLMRCSNTKFQPTAKYRMFSPFAPFADDGRESGGDVNYDEFAPANLLGVPGGGGPIGALAGMGIFIGAVFVGQLIAVVCVRIYMCCRPLSRDEKRAMHMTGKEVVATTNTAQPTSLGQLEEDGSAAAPPPLQITTAAEGGDDREGDYIPPTIAGAAGIDDDDAIRAGNDNANADNDDADAYVDERHHGGATDATSPRTHIRVLSRRHRGGGGEDNDLSSSDYTSTSEEDYNLENLRSSASIGGFRRRGNRRYKPSAATTDDGGAALDDGHNEGRHGRYYSPPSSPYMCAYSPHRSAASGAGGIVRSSESTAMLAYPQLMREERFKHIFVTTSRHWNAEETDLVYSPVTSTRAVRRRAGFERDHTTDEESDVEDVDRWERRQQEKEMERMGIDPSAAAMHRLGTNTSNCAEGGGDAGGLGALVVPMKEGGDGDAEEEEEEDYLNDPAYDDDTITAAAYRRNELMLARMAEARAKAAERKRRLLEKRTNQLLTGSSRSPFVQGDINTALIREDLEEIPFDIYQHRLVKTFYYNSWVGACASCYFPSLTFMSVDACFLGLVFVSIQMMQGPGEFFTNANDDEGLTRSAEMSHTYEQMVGAVTIVLCALYLVGGSLALPSLLLQRSYLAVTYPATISKQAVDEPLTDDEDDESREVEQRAARKLLLQRQRVEHARRLKELQEQKQKQEEAAASKKEKKDKRSTSPSTTTAAAAAEGAEGGGDGSKREKRSKSDKKEKKDKSSSSKRSGSAATTDAAAAEGEEGGAPTEGGGEDASHTVAATATVVDSAEAAADDVQLTEEEREALRRRRKREKKRKEAEAAAAAERAKEEAELRQIEEEERKLDAEIAAAGGRRRARDPTLTRLPDGPLPFSTRCPLWVQWLFFPKGIVMSAETYRMFGSVVSYSRQHPLWPTLPLWSPITLGVLGSFPVRDDPHGCAALYAFIAIFHFFYAFVVFVMGPFRYRIVNLLAGLNFIGTAILVCLAAAAAPKDGGEASDRLAMGAIALAYIQVVFTVCRLVAELLPFAFFTTILESSVLRLEWVYFAPYADVKDRAKKIPQKAIEAGKALGDLLSEMADDMATWCDDGNAPQQQPHTRNHPNSNNRDQQQQQEESEQQPKELIPREDRDPLLMVVDRNNEAEEGAAAAEGGPPEETEEMVEQKSNHQDDDDAARVTNSIEDDPLLGDSKTAAATRSDAGGNILSSAFNEVDIDALLAEIAEKERAEKEAEKLRRKEEKRREKEEKKRKLSLLGGGGEEGTYGGDGSSPTSGSPHSPFLLQPFMEHDVDHHQNGHANAAPSANLTSASAEDDDDELLGSPKDVTRRHTATAPTPKTASRRLNMDDSTTAMSGAADDDEMLGFAPLPLGDSIIIVGGGGGGGNRTAAGGVVSDYDYTNVPNASILSPHSTFALNSPDGGNRRDRAQRRTGRSVSIIIGDEVVMPRKKRTEETNTTANDGDTAGGGDGGDGDAVTSSLNAVVAKAAEDDSGKKKDKKSKKDKSDKKDKKDKASINTSSSLASPPTAEGAAAAAAAESSPETIIAAADPRVTAPPPISLRTVNSILTDALGAQHALNSSGNSATGPGGRADSFFGRYVETVGGSTEVGDDGDVYRGLGSDDANGDDDDDAIDSLDGEMSASFAHHHRGESHRRRRSSAAVSYNAAVAAAASPKTLLRSHPLEDGGGGASTCSSSHAPSSSSSLFPLVSVTAASAAAAPVFVRVEDSIAFAALDGGGGGGGAHHQHHRYEDHRPAPLTGLSSSSGNDANKKKKGPPLIQFLDVGASAGAAADSFAITQVESVHLDDTAANTNGSTHAGEEGARKQKVKEEPTQLLNASMFYPFDKAMVATVPTNSMYFDPLLASNRKRTKTITEEEEGDGGDAAAVQEEDEAAAKLRRKKEKRERAASLAAAAAAAASTVAVANSGGESVVVENASMISTGNADAKAKREKKDKKRDASPSAVATSAAEAVPAETDEDRRKREKKEKKDKRDRSASRKDTKNK